MLLVHPSSLLSTCNRRLRCWKMSCYNLLFATGDFLSFTSGTTVKPQSSRCPSRLGCTVEQVSSSLSSSLNAISATSPFSVEPRSGTIPARQEQLFQMKFSPVCVGDFETRMLCR